MWFQAGGDARGQAWTGLFRDEDANGVMEFAGPETRLPKGLGSHENNFLKWQQPDGTELLDLPANATVHVTWFNFDGASGLRNPFYGRPQGIDGNSVLVDGKPATSIDPNDASHTFAVPALGIIVAAPGVADDAKNQCGFAPCPMSTAHRTVQFTFHTTTPGHFRWQCFVPCAAGTLYGNGGPMQTLGYMAGELQVG